MHSNFSRMIFLPRQVCIFTISLSIQLFLFPVAHSSSRACVLSGRTEQMQMNAWKSLWRLQRDQVKFAVMASSHKTLLYSTSQDAALHVQFHEMHHSSFVLYSSISLKWMLYFSPFFSFFPNGRCFCYCLRKKESLWRPFKAFLGGWTVALQGLKCSDCEKWRCSSLVPVKTRTGKEFKCTWIYFSL